MNGRTRLTWVTALTVASLLLGGGAINALAEGRGGGHGGGGGQGNSGHQQQQQEQKPAVSHKDDGKPQTAAQPTNNHEDNDVERSRGDDKNKDKDQDDLVTKPARVTDDVRPGEGCGDQNHEHERADECKHKEDADDENDDDASVATVASVGADDMTMAVVDDRDDN